MDEGMGDEFTPIEVIGGNHLQSKDSEFTLKPSSSGSDVLGLNEMVIPRDCDDHENSPGFYADTLNADNLDRIGASEHACASPRCMDNAGVMVEELTSRKYNSENLTMVGNSSHRDKLRTRPSQWQHLYRIAGGSGNGVSHGDVSYRVNSGTMPSVWEDMGYPINPELLDQKPPNSNHNEFTGNLPCNTSKIASSNTLLSPSGIRTKILSKSGFSEYFVKNTLKGKGAICRGSAVDGLGVELKDKTNPKATVVSIVDSDAFLSSNREPVVYPSHSVAKPSSGLSVDTFHDGVSLREWVKSEQNKVDKVNSLHIFKQIVDIVNISHSRGAALIDLRPSFFKLLPSNQVVYVGSSAQKEIIENFRDQDVRDSESDRKEKRPLEQVSCPIVSQLAKKRKHGETTNLMSRWPHFPNRSGCNSSNETVVNFAGPRNIGNEFNVECNPKTEFRTRSDTSGLHVSDTSKSLLMSGIDPSEVKWYTCPEKLNESCTFSSNVYCLGVLLFELLCPFDSERFHAVAMLDLRHRILPPKFLSECPKEAGFCLWLLHPEPTSRPTAREILHSEVINGIQELRGDELSSSITQEDAESELLMHFLVSLKDQKLKSSSKLVEEIKFLQGDIEEVKKRQTRKSLFLSCSPEESLNLKGNKSSHGDFSSLGVNSNVSSPSFNELRLMKNINQLKSAYSSVRSNVQLSSSNVSTRDGKDLLQSRENWFQTHNKGNGTENPSDRLGDFFNGLCKYSRYSKFKVRGILRNGDFNNSANVICSLSFDRDEDYFAAAGVSKKIKIYDYHAISNDAVDIHYPVVELSNKSKLSCTCWNNYIRNYLASTDYDGTVKLWDAGTGQGISQYIEHDRRAWSVDFSRVDPTKLASGSDDCSVKMWNINERNSLCTIRNIANVCCVQFSANSSHLLAFGSADYKIYCYDLRNVSTPWCILSSHGKAVSYVKFLDSETLVSASTDNTLKIWDLNKTGTSGLSTNACILTLGGHTNEKNFVGLSVADGYIACGSETNEVFTYYRSLPMPITSHKFGSVDPISGKETDDDGGQFVSSVCWRQKSETIVAANSSGSIKLFQML